MADIARLVGGVLMVVGTLIAIWVGTQIARDEIRAARDKRVK